MTTTITTKPSSWWSLYRRSRTRARSRVFGSGPFGWDKLDNSWYGFCNKLRQLHRITMPEFCCINFLQNCHSLSNVLHCPIVASHSTGDPAVTGNPGVPLLPLLQRPQRLFIRAVTVHWWKWTRDRTFFFSSQITVQNLKLELQSHS